MVSVCSPFGTRCALSADMPKLSGSKLTRYNAAKTIPTPLLDSLLASGVVWVEGSDYIGRASDGVVVSIGIVGMERTAEDYLKIHSTPDTW